ncbi:lipid phosphate phosphatase-related type 3 [Micractinium conductrix]|uniref:Lipid phosphate phosphatase-related type 3 n=1 Tax=Micractinium conductrix TaxID=554055 RepID=A0A2P6V8E5_9CHLO|nr:lipid phosphate phosphatase-related type 3 [Micractinium conductrix]|eukprot:PSC70359.1 lipid phosphate phosphatase-related type 3 [Micractinium conductrix]
MPDVEEASQSAAAADASSDAAAAAEQAWARATAAALAWEKEAAAAKAAMLKAQQASREAAAARDEVLESAAQARGCSACCLWWVGSLGIDDQHFLYINRNVLATLIQAATVLITALGSLLAKQNSSAVFGLSITAAVLHFCIALVKPDVGEEATEEQPTGTGAGVTEDGGATAPVWRPPMALGLAMAARVSPPPAPGSVTPAAPQPQAKRVFRRPLAPGLF